MTSLITIAIYAVAFVDIIYSVVIKKQNLASTRVLGIIAAGLVVHAFSVYQDMSQAGTLALGFFHVISLFFFVINLLVLISCLKRPLHNLFIFLMPFSILGMLVSQAFDAPMHGDIKLSAGMVAHILLSILAYSLLTIATIQALLLAYQNKQLKQKHFQAVRGIMPPLQTMESLLFDIVLVGFLLLTCSILTGVIYIENLLEQRLSHKTLFSVVSWFIYAILLARHHLYGLRGAAAIRWVLGGFAALMLAYFGSKLVIEVILGNP